MELGAFSVSLPVRDIRASRSFYEALGFSAMAGAEEDNWLVLRNGPHVIGLFHGMFERPMLTFNPGWDQGAQALPSFTDVRELHARTAERGLRILSGLSGTAPGPGSFMLEDPDGNPVLIDQHVSQQVNTGDKSV